MKASNSIWRMFAAFIHHRMSVSVGMSNSWMTLPARPGRPPQVGQRAGRPRREGAPVVVCHGGPGSPHDYLENLPELLGERAVVLSLPGTVRTRPATGKLRF